jgi:hypothetical protein
MPWQEYVARVATETLEDGSYAYQVVVVTVPRQSGKTTLLGAMACERCTMHDNHGIRYTAQTGKDARDRWNDLTKLVADSPLRHQVKARRSQGSERLVFPNGSEYRVFAPTADALHGSTPPTVVLDEAFAHTESVGNALMGAIGPAQVTLIDRQLWIVSTEGTAESVFLAKWIAAGRAGADRVALFDWGAGPEITDPYDRAGWHTFHPALGITITEDAIASEAARLPRSEFERAYCNRRTRTETHTISPNDWQGLAEVQVPPTDLKRMVLTYAVAHDGTSSAVGAVWRDAAGKPQAKLVRWAPGHSWVAGEVAEFAQRWGPRLIAAPSNGPTREVTAELNRRKGVKAPRQLTAPEYAQAWAAMMEGIRTRGFGHDGSKHLADAAANVVPRQTESGAAPSWKGSAGDISALVTLMVGLWAQEDTPDRPQHIVMSFD